MRPSVLYSRAAAGALLVVVCLVAAVGAFHWASRPPEERPPAADGGAEARPAEPIRERREVLEHARRLSSLNRTSGTAGCRQAAGYIEGKLRQWGLEPRYQEFDVVIPVTKEMEFTVEGEVFQIHPLWPNWTRTCTTRGVLSGPLAYAGEGKLKSFRGLPMEGARYSQGRKPIVILEGDKGLDWYSAAMLGAQAIIFCESDATNRVEMENKVSLLPANIPRFYCDAETGKRLRELAVGFQQQRAAETDEEQLAALAGRPAAELRCRVDWETRTTRNIIARLDGTDPEQLAPVIFQAYYDSVSTVPDIAYGAESSCGAATLLELAREFAAARPKRSIIFAFFSGHFESMLGSKAFFGVMRKPHAKWLEVATTLEESVLGTSALSGPRFFERPQATAGVLACAAAVVLALVWLFVRKEGLLFGAGGGVILALSMFLWAWLIPEKELPTGSLKLPRLEAARLAAAPLETRAPEAYRRVLEDLTAADGRISAVDGARSDYEKLCEERAKVREALEETLKQRAEAGPAERAGLDRKAAEKAREIGRLDREALPKAQKLLARGRDACVTLATYDKAIAALRWVPPEAREDAAAGVRAIEVLIARDMSSSNRLPLYLDALESLLALEKLGPDLPEKIAFSFSLDLSSKSEGVAFLFKGSFVDQHEKNYETTLARCIAPIADVSVKVGEKLAPGVLTNCVVNPRGLHWTNHTGGNIATDNEIALLAGFPSSCLASAHDARDLLDTPLDVFESLDRRRLTQQASFLIEWARKVVDDPRTAAYLKTMQDEQLLSKERFRTISARTVEFDMNRGMGVADKPVPGALMLCYHDPGYYMRQKLRKMLWGVREVEMRFADERGAVLFSAIPDALARYWNDKPRTVEAYDFDLATGDLIMAPDRGEQGAKKFKPTVIPQRENEFLSCVVFPCVDVSIFDTLDQRRYYMFTHVEIFDAETDAEPFRYGYRITGRVGYNKSYIEPCAVLFLEPLTKFKLLFGSGATGTKYSLINAPEPTKEAHGGIGYEAATSMVLSHTPYKMARDLWNLDEYRIQNLVKHGVTNAQVQNLHDGSREALDAARKANEEGKFDEGVMRAREAWSYEAKAYPRVRGTTSDMLRGALFYLFLVLPFAYFTERLLFGFASINRQLLGFFGIFLLVFLLLAVVHPAFGMTNSAPVVLLAFLSVALSLLVLGMIRSRFELELQRLQQRVGAASRADFSRLDAAKSAFVLGISNMRRRKVRTVLTLLTLVALTFSVLSFTSMEPEDQILEHEILNLARGRSTQEGELDLPIKLGDEGLSEADGGVESTGRLRMRDWLAVQGTFDEGGPARLELVDSDGDQGVMEFRPGEGYAAYALTVGGGAYLRSPWWIAGVVLLVVGGVASAAGGKRRPYGLAALGLAALFGVMHFMPKGSAAGGVAPAELDPLDKAVAEGEPAGHRWALRFNPETRECIAVVDDQLVRRFRGAFLDPPLFVRARPRPASLVADEERRGIPWQGIMIRSRGWGSMSSQTLRYILDEFDASEGHIVAPRAWWLLSQIEATATLITNAERPGKSFFAQGIVGMSAAETEFTRPQDDLVAGRWLKGGEEQSCVLPRKIASACGIAPDDLANGPRVLILGEEMTVVGITDDDLWSNKADIDTEPISPVDYTVENWMKHSGAQRSEFELYHYTHLSPLNVPYVPYSFLISRGGTLRSIAIKPAGGVSKELKAHLLKKLSVPLFVAEEEKVTYASSAGARPIRGIGGLLVPMLICALIVLNTMMSSVFEREREIWIYGSLGLAPVHIGSLFMAESLVFSVMGTVVGYVLGQMVAKLVAMGLFLEGLSLNYSSTSAVFSAIFVMGMVIVSTLYPSLRASRLSVPDIDRIWKYPDAVGDVLSIDFPFTMSGEQAFGVSMHLTRFFQDHSDQSVGEFYTANARLVPREAGGVFVDCRAWIAPFDFGISQAVRLEVYPGDEQDIYEARMILTRLSGEPASWHRMNQRFLGNIRKQFLVWRLFSPEERTYYLEEAKKELSVGT